MQQHIMDELNYLNALRKNLHYLINELMLKVLKEMVSYVVHVY